MEKKENNSNKLMLFVAISLLVVSLIAFIISLNMDSITSLEKKEIPITIKIDNRTALNMSKNESILNLGSVAVSNYASRNLTISNDYSFKTVFEFDIIGDIAPLMIFQPVIIFEPNEKKDLLFRTKIITNESFGEYSGTLLIRIKKFIEE